MRIIIYVFTDRENRRNLGGGMAWIIIQTGQPVAIYPLPFLHHLSHPLSPSLSLSKIPILLRLFYLSSLSSMAHLDQNSCWRKTPPKPTQNINGKFYVIRKSRVEEIHKMSSSIQPHTLFPQIPSCFPPGVFYFLSLKPLREALLSFLSLCACG